MSEEEVTIETYEQGTGKLLKTEKVKRPKTVNPHQDCIDLLSDPKWNSLTADQKREALRTALLKHLE